MSPGATWTLGRRPTLDGLRGLAVLLVLVGHTGFQFVHTAGRVGVTVFFALSGFLITALLLQELRSTARLDLPGFYARRARRLLPALVVFLASMIGVSLLSDKSTAPPWEDYLGALFYVANYVISMRAHDNVIGHTWSLSVEEQFYIVWPLVVVLVLGRVGRGRAFRLAAVAVGCSLLAIVLRLVLWDGGEGWRRVYYGTDTRMDGLLWGCLLAIYMTGRSPGRNRPVVAVACLAGIVLLSLGRGEVEFLVVPTVVPVLTAGAIWALTQQPQSRLLTSSTLRYLGRRSYALYLWHFPLFGAAATLPMPVRWPALVVAAVLSVLIAEFSWRCVEEPFLRLGRGTSTGGDAGSARDDSAEKSAEGLASGKPSV